MHRRWANVRIGLLGAAGLVSRGPVAEAHSLLAAELDEVLR